MANWDILYVSAGRQVDGVDETEVRRLLADGELEADDCLRRSGETRWRRVADLRSKSAKQAEEERKQQTSEEEEVQEETSRPPAMMAAAAVVGGAPGTVASHAHGEEDDIVSWTPQLHVDELDMTPMVDVVLLLLLFFMVTASYMMQKVIEIPKPNPDRSRAAAKTRAQLMKEYIMVEIDERNQFSVEDEPLKGLPLKDVIARAMAESGKQKMFVIAEGASHHGSIVQAFDAATDAKVPPPILLSVRDD